METTTQLPDGWTHETQGPTTDAYYHDALPLGVVHDRSETPARYTVVHTQDGTPAERADGTTREFPTLPEALTDAARGT